MSIARSVKGSIVGDFQRGNPEDYGIIRTEECDGRRKDYGETGKKGPLGRGPSQKSPQVLGWSHALHDRLLFSLGRHRPDLQARRTVVVPCGDSA